MARDVAWYQKLGCDQDPFSLNPAVDRFYFETPALASHLNTLTGVASKGEFIGLVKGDRGIGKTTLLNQMARRFRDDPDVAFTRVTCTEGCSLIQSLGISSGLTEEELAVEPRKVLIEHLTRLRTGGQKVVAAIDDAHLLSPQDLAMLIRIGLSPNASGLVHTILFAEADIEARLWLSAINDPLPLDRLYTLILTPLAAEQTQAYLTHRLAAVGLDKVSFSGSEAATIHRRSEGLPAAINEHAGQRLERRYGPAWSRGLGAVQRFRPAWAAGLAGVAVVAGLAVWQREPLTQWATSLNLQLPFASDATGTEVAIAIPGQPGEKPAEATDLPKPARPDDSPVTVAQTLTPTVESGDTSTLRAPAVDSGSALATVTNDGAATDDSNPITPGEDLSGIGETTTDLLAVAPTLPPGETLNPGSSTDDTTLLPDPPALPESLRERLREREQQQAEQSLVEATPESQEQRVSPVLTPPPLTSFPRLAGLTVPHVQAEPGVAAPATPETPSTPITGRPGASDPAATETSAAPVVRPRPRPAAPSSPTIADAAPLSVEETAATGSGDVASDVETVADTPVARQVPRPRPKPAVPPAPQVVASSTQPETASPSVVPSTSPGGEVAGSPAQASTAQSVPLAEVRREDWVRRQPPGEYVIQLLVASEEDKLRSYIAGQRFPAPPAYYQRAAQGTYVLVLGPYVDQRQARQAINSLPRGLQRNDPWIRSMASVQQELR